MPYLVYTDQAIRDLRRLRGFLQPKSPRAATRAGEIILFHLDVLKATPEIGRPLDEQRRELIIPFANSGYVALYAHDPIEDVVVIQSIRHQSEQTGD